MRISVPPRRVPVGQERRLPRLWPQCDMRNLRFFNEHTKLWDFCFEVLQCMAGTPLLSCRFADDELLVRASAVLKSQGPENWSRGKPHADLPGFGFAFFVCGAGRKRFV